MLAEPPSEVTPRLVRALGLGGAPDAAAYSDVFLFQLYPYASVHVGAEGMMGGEAQARVAGFWRALGRRMPTEPDHLSALVALYASLLEADQGPSDARAVLIRESRGALLREHLEPWVFHFLGRIAEVARGTYAAWAALLSEALRSEVEVQSSERGSRPLPLHLRVAPALPDPRTGGAAPFLSGLLAPVRSGMILTRADLARIAGELGLGLRAGERRYALEHLLAQAPGLVLSALAAEARRQGAAHQARASWLEASAMFHAARARACAELLEALASEQVDGLEQAAADAAS